MPTTRFVGASLALVGAGIATLLPVFLVLYPAAGIGPADAANPAVVLPVLAANPALFVGPGLIELAAHALGAVAVIGLWLRWGDRSFLLRCATLAGIVWMSVDTIDNAMALQLVPRLATDFVGGGASAGPDYRFVSALIDALRLAGHFAGGLWIVGLSAHALRARLANPLVAWAGVGAGAILAANPIVPALLNVSFLTLPAWLIVFGLALTRRGGADPAAVLASAAA